MDQLREVPALASATILLPELLLLVTTSLLLIFFLAGFFVLGMLFRKASWTAIGCWQEARKKRIVFPKQRPPRPHTLQKERGSQEIFQFNGGAPTSTAPRWNGAAKSDLFARHL